PANLRVPLPGCSRRLRPTGQRGRALARGPCVLRSPDGGPSVQLSPLAPSENDAMRVGIAHHFGWAVAVTASSDHDVVDRRRIELIEDGVPNAPVHHMGGAHAMHGTSKVLDDDALAALVAKV